MKNCSRLLQIRISVSLSFFTFFDFFTLPRTICGALYFRAQTWVVCLRLKAAAAISSSVSPLTEGIIVKWFSCKFSSKSVTHSNVMISAASSSSNLPLCTFWISKERLPESPGTARRVYVLVDILGHEPRWTSRPLATYWKMFFVTAPRDPSMNIPMLIRMQWKRFCSTLTTNF